MLRNLHGVGASGKRRELDRSVRRCQRRPAAVNSRAQLHVSIAGRHLHGDRAEFRRRDVSHAGGHARIGTQPDLFSRQTVEVGVVVICSGNGDAPCSLLSNWDRVGAVGGQGDGHVVARSCGGCFKVLVASCRVGCRQLESAVQRRRSGDQCQITTGFRAWAHIDIDGARSEVGG